MKFSWINPMNKKEEEEMKKFIVCLYDEFVKWGDDDRFIDHVLSSSIREITRIIGECKNLCISLKAKKYFVNCKTFYDYQTAVKKNSNKLIKEHFYPVKDFLDEFRKKKKEGKQFTRKDAERWLNDSTIAYITKDEDALLRNEFGNKRYRPPSSYEKIGIKLEKAKL